MLENFWKKNVACRKIDKNLIYKFFFNHEVLNEENLKNVFLLKNMKEKFKKYVFKKKNIEKILNIFFI